MNTNGSMAAGAFAARPDEGVAPGRAAMSIRMSLVLIFGGLCGMFMLVVAVGVKALWDNHRSLEAMAQRHLPAIEALNDSTRLILRAINRFDAFDAAFGAGDLDTAQQMLQTGKRDLAEATRRWVAYETLPRSGDEAPMTRQLQQRFQTLVEDRLPRALEALDAYDLAGYRETSRSAVAEAFDAFDQAAAAAVQLRRDDAGRSFDASQRQLRSMSILMAISLGVALVAAWASLLILHRKINRPIDALAGAMRQMAEGDLSAEIRVPARDEVGRLFASLALMQRGLRSIVSEVRAGSESIHAGSREIAAGSADLSARTELQAAALQAASARVASVATNLHTTSVNAETARRLAVDAAASAQQGAGETRQTVGAMVAINRQMHRVRELMDSIDAIARQTSILSLNAGVEAARAGNSGHGFAVVAREVGELAKRSAQAARDAQVVIADTDATVDQGASLAQHAAQGMARVAEAAEGVVDIIAQISETAIRQDSDIRQINESIGQIEGSIARDAALVEESAASASVLAVQTARLHDAVKAFRLQPAAGSCREGSP